MADDLRADLDQLLFQAGQRPVLDRLGRRQRAQEVADIVGEREAVAGCFASWGARCLLATLQRAGCGTVLSEDMGDGGTLGGLIVEKSCSEGC